MSPERASQVLWLLAVALTLAFIYMILMLVRGQLAEKPRVIRLKGIKPSLKENTAVEIRAYLEGVLKQLPVQARDLEKGPPTEEQLRQLDIAVPGPVKQHSEDLGFLLDLSEWLGVTPEGGSFQERNVLCRAYYAAAYLAYYFRDFGRAIYWLSKVIRFSDDVLDSLSVGKSKAYFDKGTFHLTRYQLPTEEDSKVEDLAQAVHDLEMAVSTTSITLGPQADRDRRQLSLALYNLAWALDELGRVKRDPQYFRQAVGHLERAIEISPSLALAKYNLACALMKLDEPRRAVQVLKTIASGPVWKEIAADLDFQPLRQDHELESQFDALVRERLPRESAASAG